MVKMVVKRIGNGDTKIALGEQAKRTITCKSCSRLMLKGIFLMTMAVGITSESLTGDGSCPPKRMGPEPICSEGAASDP